MAETSHDNKKALPRKKTPKRPPTYNKRLTGLDQYTCNVDLNIVARKVKIEKANNEGIATYGAINKVVKEMKATLP